MQGFLAGLRRGLDSSITLGPCKCACVRVYTTYCDGAANLKTRRHCFFSCRFKVQANHHQWSHRPPLSLAAPGDTQLSCLSGQKGRRLMAGVPAQLAWAWPRPKKPLQQSLTGQARHQTGRRRQERTHCTCNMQCAALVTLGLLSTGTTLLAGLARLGRVIQKLPESSAI